MTASQGQTLRRVGLLIEVLCMLGLTGLWRGQFSIWNGFPVDPSVFLSVVLGIGFLLWVTGTVAIYRGRKG